MNIVIKGELTDLNTYIKALNSHRLSGNKVKKDNTIIVYSEAREYPEVEKYPVKITYSWYSKDNRKDIDNVCFAKKFINDGLVLAGVLRNDSRKYVSGFEDRFYIDSDNPRVEIEIS